MTTETTDTAARARLSLDGVWEFRHDSDSRWREARVPGVWQQFPDLAWAFGTALYRRRLSVPADWRGRESAAHAKSPAPNSAGRRFSIGT